VTEQIRDEKKGLFIALDDINAQPSLARIFSIIEIGPLFDKEVREFFERTFNSVNMKVERKAMKFMVHYSTGLPFLMQEIGDATFWIDEDGIIKDEDARRGIITAAEEIGKKYLDVKVYHTEALQ